MMTKKCTVEPTPEPPPPDPCKQLRIRKKLEAGVKLCPRKPVEPPPPVPECLGICIEKIKNPDVVVTDSGIIRCIVEREVTGNARCDAIRDLTAALPDTPFPGCQPPPPLPPPPPPDLCELQEKRRKRELCKERLKRYYEFSKNETNSSSTDYLIDKLKKEIRRESEEDFRNTTRSALENPNVSYIPNNPSTHSIDQQITDLECLIKRLENEILEKSNDKMEEKMKVEYEETRKSDQRAVYINGVTREYSDQFVYQVVERDNDKGIADNHTTDQKAHCQALNEASDTFVNVRNNFSMLWNTDSPNIQAVDIKDQIIKNIFDEINTDNSDAD